MNNREKSKVYAVLDNGVLLIVERKLAKRLGSSSLTAPTVLTRLQNCCGLFVAVS